MPKAVRRGLTGPALLAHLLLGRMSRTGTLALGAALMLSLGVIWSVSYLAGGTRSAVPQLFYLPIIVASVRFSWSGALGIAVPAGLLAGPLLPADVAAGTAQPLAGWLLRLCVFVCVGLLVAWLVRAQAVPIGTRVQDALISSRLVAAVRRGEVEVFYQPILDTGTGRVVAVEALARWNDPRSGYLSPADFIPQAERTGAIRVLDDHVLGVAGAQAQRWATDPAAVPVRVSVNISATRFAEDDLPVRVTEILSETGLTPGRLQLEVTESAVIDDIAAARDQIAKLRALGVRVAIDDFGTERSSLSYLTEFTVDTIKIDRSLLVAFPRQPRAKQLLSGLIRLFAALDLEVVAEGVETPEQYLHLQEVDCGLVQGFATGRPAPTSETTALLHRQTTSPSPPHA